MHRYDIFAEQLTPIPSTRCRRWCTYWCIYLHLVNRDWGSKAYRSISGRLFNFCLYVHVRSILPSSGSSYNNFFQIIKFFFGNYYLFCFLNPLSTGPARSHVEKSLARDERLVLLRYIINPRSFVMTPVNRELINLVCVSGIESSLPCELVGVYAYCNARHHSVFFLFFLPFFITALSLSLSLSFSLISNRSLWPISILLRLSADSARCIIRSFIMLRFHYAACAAVVYIRAYACVRNVTHVSSHRSIFNLEFIIF